MSLQLSRFAAPAAAAALTVVALTARASPNAQAATSVYNSKSTNVFYRYGIPPVSGSGYTNGVYIYNKHSGQFDPNTSKRFGYIVASHGKLRTKLASGERIVNTDVDYQLANGKQKHVAWNGKHALAVQRKVNGQSARLVVAVVNVHSSHLPNQGG